MNLVPLIFIFTFRLFLFTQKDVFRRFSPDTNGLGVVFNESQFIRLYHNVSNQSEAEDDDTEHDRGGTNVVGNVRRRVIIARVLVRREISESALIVQRRQQLYVLTGTRKVRVSSMREVQQ